ncbi:uncharacterized protein LOC135391498 isoform X1 [Ornithodoros turicata]|uniref:uncharacterized protein LOC135391498 isoform X1 n=1 Tax=Ornithodoros turicata TaxID=34597 RepID=UPI00313984CC
MLPYRLSVAGQQLQYSTSCKFLGVTLDSRLSWRRHIAGLEKKLSKGIALMRHIAGLRWCCDARSLLAIHRALVRGPPLYSLPVLHGISPSSESKLQCLLARSLRVCLGVPRTTDTCLVMAEARETPLAIQRFNETSRHYIRLLAHHRRHRLLLKLSRRRNNKFRSCIQQLEPHLPRFQAEPQARSTPPWTLPLPSASLSIPALQRKDDVAAGVSKALTLNMMSELYAGFTPVFTDGSSTKASSACAYIIPSEDITGIFRLSHLASSTCAELHDLLFAMHKMLQCSARPWVFYTDSKAAIQCLATMGIRSPLMSNVADVLETYKELLDLGHCIVLQWVPGHVGLPGNEEADRAALRGHHIASAHSIILPKGDRQALVRALSADKTRSQWLHDITPYSLLHAVDPSLSLSLPHRLPRHYASLLHRMPLNVAFTPVMRQRLGRAPSDLCAACSVRADLHHLLMDCPDYQREREIIAHLP